MFQTGGSHGEFERIGRRGKVCEAIDQPRGKAVAAAHTVHDVGNFIMPAQKELFARVEAGGPAVVGSAFRFPERDGDHLEIRKCSQNPLGQFFVLLAFETAGFHIDVHVNVNALLAVFLVRNADIDQFHQFRHNLAGRFAPLP